MNEIKLTIGDPSNDGHGHVESMLFNTNYRRNQLQAAYRASIELTGVDLVNKVADEYENTSIPEHILTMLDTYDCPVTIEESDDVSQEEFVELWWWFVSLSAPDLIFEYATTNSEEIEIGGYGFFE